MTRTPDLLLSRFLGAEERAPEEAGDPRVAAELAAQALASAQDIDGDAELRVAMMAAYLDGELTDSDRVETDAILAASPAALEEMASTAAFVDAVSEKRRPVPRDLLVQAVATPERERAPRRFKWRWACAVAAVAAAVAVVVLGTHAFRSVDPKAPLMATPSTGKEPARLAEPERKGPLAPTMVPAGSDEVVPQHDPSQKPRLAPDEMDVAPAPRSDRR